MSTSNNAILDKKPVHAVARKVRSLARWSLALIFGLLVIAGSDWCSIFFERRGIEMVCRLYGSGGKRPVKCSVAA